jgi:8-oxo-dGTP diphosphatase
LWGCAIKDNVVESIRIRVGLAVVQDERIVLVPSYDTDAGPVQWCIPGGRLRFGECLEAAAVREFEEETGFGAEVGGLLDVSEVILPERPYHSITITFSGRLLGGEERPEPDHPTGRKVPRWFSTQELASAAYHPKGTIDRTLGESG